MKTIETTLEVWDKLHTQVRASNALAASVQNALRRSHGKVLTVSLTAALERYRHAISAKNVNTAVIEYCAACGAPGLLRKSAHLTNHGRCAHDPLEGHVPRVTPEETKKLDTFPYSRTSASQTVFAARFVGPSLRATVEAYIKEGNPIYAVRAVWQALRDDFSVSLSNAKEYVDAVSEELEQSAAPWNRRAGV